MQTLRDLNQKDGLTVVVTLHQVDYTMRFCPRTVALKKGEIVYDGPTERLSPSSWRNCTALKATSFLPPRPAPPKKR